jgi:aminoglycoside 6'-N-acetyltransferase
LLADWRTVEHVTRLDLMEGRLRLRALEPGDERELTRLHRDPAVARWWDEPDAEFPWDEPSSTRLTILYEGAIAGLIQYWEETEPKYRHAGIDLFVDPRLHGRGIGSGAVSALARALIERRAHHRITVDPAAANAAALRAYEKAGFERVGVMRRAERDADGGGWHDCVLMELVVGERGA